MLTLKQFASWKRIFDDDPELADTVLRLLYRELSCTFTAEEALALLLSDDAKLPQTYGMTQAESLAFDISRLREERRG